MKKGMLSPLAAGVHGVVVHRDAPPGVAVNCRHGVDVGAVRHDRGVLDVGGLKANLAGLKASLLA